MKDSYGRQLTPEEIGDFDVSNKRKKAKIDHAKKQRELNTKRKNEKLKMAAKLINSDAPITSNNSVKIKIVGRVILPDLFQPEKRPKKGKTFTRLGHKGKLAELYNNQDGKCFYCGKKMKYRAGSGNSAKDGATIEHLYPKTDIRRLLLSPSEYIVAACFKCNQEQNRKAHLEMYDGYKEKAPRLINFLTPTNQNESENQQN